MNRYYNTKWTREDKMGSEINGQKSHNISKISTASFVLVVGGIIAYVVNSTILKVPPLMTLIMLLWIIGLALGLIDIIKKERRKILSYITVLISGIPLLIALFIIAFYNNIP